MSPNSLSQSFSSCDWGIGRAPPSDSQYAAATSRLIFMSFLMTWPSRNGFLMGFAKTSVSLNLHFYSIMFFRVYFFSYLQHENKWKINSKKLFFGSFLSVKTNWVHVCTRPQFFTCSGTAQIKIYVYLHNNCFFLFFLFVEKF